MKARPLPELNQAPPPDAVPLGFGSAAMVESPSKSDMETAPYFACNAAHCALSFLDLEGRVTRWNLGMEVLLRLPRQAATGHRITRYFKPKDGSGGADADWFGPHERTEPFEVRCRGQREDGSVFPARLVFRKLRDENRRLSGFMVMAEDLSLQMAMEEALRISEERFSKAFSTNPDALVISRKRDGLILEVNDGWKNIFGYSREESVGKTSLVMGLLDPQDRIKAVEILSAQGRVRDFEVGVRGKSGQPRQVLLSADMLEISGEECILTVLRDVTECREAALSLERSEVENRALLAAIPDAIFQFDARGTCLAFKPGQETGDFGWSEALIGMTVLDVFPPEAFLDYPEIMANSRRQSQPQIREFQLQAGGRARDLEARIVPLGGERLMILLRDVTGAKNLDRAVAGIATAEQRRIGGELHDGTCQELVGISMLCKSLRGGLGGDHPELVAQAEEIYHLTTRSIANLRTLIAGLYPPGLEMGLAHALQELARGLGRIYPIEFSFSGNDPNLEQDVAAHLYRIAQEAANNAARHGSPRSVRISLERHGQFLILRVVDDGHGFTADNQNPESRGHDIMRYRARLVGGTVEIHSRVGNGCTVTCRISPGKS